MATSMQPDNVMLSKLWDNIVELHWQYMETDENLEKLDRRKKLEVRLKEFLCKIQHDRKFFLPVTSKVLKVSLKMKNFSASKALIGFESISQYANNLFTKPWRKEYRTIKMYSGFYQHEIAANLMDAEQLFIEMGYKLLPNQTLLLVGAICPDQVSNVSRDAMTAYVECQIMNEICCGLIKMQLSAPWPNILNFREAYVGDEIDAIKMLALNIYRRQHNNREKAIIGVGAENLYNGSTMNNCAHLIDNNQTSNCYQSAPPPPPPPPPLSNGYFANVQQQQQSSYYNNKISNSNKGQSTIAYGYGNCGNIDRSGAANNNSTHMPPLTLSHSKSLDHYDDHHSHHHNVHQNRNNFYQTTCNQGRYASFDHQYCDSNRTPAICDYSQQCASINNLNLYNIPGSRCALPISLSNHLLPGANQTNKIHQSSAACNDCQKQYLSKTTANDYACNDVYCHGCGSNIKRSIPQLSPPISTSLSFQHQQQQLPLSNSTAMALNHYCDNSVENCVSKTERLPNDRLIDFDDRPVTNIYANANKSDYYERKQNGLQNDDTNDTYTRHNYQQQQLVDSTYAKCVKNQQRSIAAVSAIIKKVPTIEYDNVDSGLAHHNQDNDGNVHLYSTNTNGKRKVPMSSNSENVDYDDLPINNFSESNSFDSADIDYMPPITINPFNNSSSSSGATTTTISNKNQDGVGSYESWNFVYKILERRGYNKDRGDLYVRGLDLNPVPDAAAEKKIIWDEDGQYTMTNNDEPQAITNNYHPHHKDQAFNNDNYVLSDVAIKPPEQYDSVHENSKVISTPSNNYNQLNGGGGVNELKSSSINNVPISHLENCQAVDAQRRQIQEHQMRQQKENERQQLFHSKQQLADKSKEIRAQKHQNHYNSNPSKKAENVESKHVKENGTSASSYRTTTTSDSKIKRHSSSSVSDTTSNNNINEWSCKFCTFLNPNSKRICDMCSKSKDFNLDAPKKSTATCI